jgi:hypothetical protein
MRSAVASCAVALAVVGVLTVTAGAQSSCNDWYETCRKRAPSQATGARCTIALGQCQRTGCWTEAAPWGSKRHCNLKKS